MFLVCWHENGEKQWEQVSGLQARCDRFVRTLRARTGLAQDEILVLPMQDRGLERYEPEFIVPYCPACEAGLIPAASDGYTWICSDPHCGNSKIYEDLSPDEQREREEERLALGHEIFGAALDSSPAARAEMIRLAEASETLRKSISSSNYDVLVRAATEHPELLIQALVRKPLD